jgi:hypothetical protein
MSDHSLPPNRDKKPSKRFSEAVEIGQFFLGEARRVETLLTVALVIVGIGQFCVYLRQASIMETQASISKSQLQFQESVSRAWLKADIALDGPIIFTEWANDKFLNVQLKFALKNTGTVPAVNTRILTQIVPFGGSDRSVRLAKIQAQMCEQARQLSDEDKIGGEAAFPNAEKTVRTGSGTGGLYKVGDPGALAVLGCIDYTYGDDRHGQTGFRKILGKVENHQVVGIPFVSGQPKTPAEPISPELLASGYPKDPARYAEVAVGDIYFEDSDQGDFAK